MSNKFSNYSLWFQKASTSYILLHAIPQDVLFMLQFYLMISYLALEFYRKVSVIHDFMNQREAWFASWNIRPRISDFLATLYTRREIWSFPFYIRGARIFLKFKTFSPLLPSFHKTFFFYHFPLRLLNFFFCISYDNVKLTACSDKKSRQLICKMKLVLDTESISLHHHDTRSYFQVIGLYWNILNNQACNGYNSLSLSLIFLVNR